MGEEHRTYHWGADQPADQRLTVAQAAAQLGISEGAVRSRIKRGTLTTERVGGRVYVLVGPDEPTDQPGESGALISQMREEIEYLREESRRKDEIIMQQAMTMRALTAGEPSEPRERPETATEGAERAAEPWTGARGPQERVSRPWWRRVFGG